MKIFKDIKWKYVIINVIGILIFVGIFLLYDNQININVKTVETVKKTVEYENQLISLKSSSNGYIYILKDLMYIFPFVFFGLVSIIDTIKTKQTNGYAKTTLLFTIFFSIGLIIASPIATKIEDSYFIISDGTLCLLGAILIFFLRNNNNNIYKNYFINNK